MSALPQLGRDKLADQVARLLEQRILGGEWEPGHPLPPEQVQPRRIPDGLLEVALQGEAEPNLYLVEIESRPDRRAQPPRAGSA